MQHNRNQAVCSSVFHGQWQGLAITFVHVWGLSVVALAWAASERREPVYLALPCGA